MEIIVKDEYKDLIPEPSSEEYEALKDSIKTRGMQIPIVVNTEGEILDGHTRYQICKELGIEPRIEVKNFETPEEEQIFVLESNLARRQLLTAQRIKIVHEKLEPLQRELAKKRQTASLKVGNNAPIPSYAPDDNGQGGRTAEKMAEIAQTSPATYQRTVAVLEKAPEEIKDKMKSGDMTPGEAYREMKGEAKPEKNRAPPTKKYTLDSEHFDNVIAAIEQARDAGDKSATIHVQGKSVIGVNEWKEL